jgi:hypothetical protein
VTSADPLPAEPLDFPRFCRQKREPTSGPGEIALDYFRHLHYSGSIHQDTSAQAALGELMGQERAKRSSWGPTEVSTRADSKRQGL